MINEQLIAIYAGLIIGLLLVIRGWLKRISAQLALLVWAHEISDLEFLDGMEKSGLDIFAQARKKR